MYSSVLNFPCCFSALSSDSSCYWGCVHISSLTTFCFIWFGPKAKKKKKIKITYCWIFQPFWFLFTPQCLLWSESVEELVKQTKFSNTSHMRIFTSLIGQMCPQTYFLNCRLIGQKVFLWWAGCWSANTHLHPIMHCTVDNGSWFSPKNLQFFQLLGLI